MIDDYIFKISRFHIWIKHSVLFMYVCVSVLIRSYYSVQLLTCGVVVSLTIFRTKWKSTKEQVFDSTFSEEETNETLEYLSTLHYRISQLVSI